MACRSRGSQHSLGSPNEPTGEVDTHLVFMDQGVVVEEGRPTEVFANPRHDRTRAFLSRIL
jgi:ABC-type histidine transport system ATPase subunit